MNYTAILILVCLTVSAYAQCEYCGTSGECCEAYNAKASDNTGLKCADIPKPDRRMRGEAGNEEYGPALNAKEEAEAMCQIMLETTPRLRYVSPEFRRDVMQALIAKLEKLKRDPGELETMINAPAAREKRQTDWSAGELLHLIPRSDMSDARKIELMTRYNINLDIGYEALGFALKQGKKQLAEFLLGATRYCAQRNSYIEHKKEQINVLIELAIEEHETAFDTLEKLMRQVPGYWPNMKPLNPSAHAYDIISGAYMLSDRELTVDMIQYLLSHHDITVLQNLVAFFEEQEKRYAQAYYAFMNGVMSIERKMKDYIDKRDRAGRYLKSLNAIRSRRMGTHELGTK